VYHVTGPRLKEREEPSENRQLSGGGGDGGGRMLAEALLIFAALSPFFSGPHY
jgi:hypothetical protein